MNLEDWKRGGWFFNWRGLRIFHQEAGTGDALLLIHGFPTASWDWHRIWPDLTRRFHVIAPDLLGFGYSDKPTGHPYSLLEQADLVEDLLRAREISTVHILAHDYGDTVAQELLARQLERRGGGNGGIEIRSVTLLNGGLFPEATHPLLIQKMLKNRIVGPALGRLLSERTFRRSFGRIFAPGSQPTSSELQSFWSLIAHNRGQRVAHLISRYQDERRTHRARWTEALQHADVPLRLIVGAEDPISGRTIAEHFREIITDPDVVMLEGVGHYPQVEAPEKVLHALIAFLCPDSGGESTGS